MTYVEHIAKRRALANAHVARLRGCAECDRLLDDCRVETSGRALDALREHHRRCLAFRHNSEQGARYLADVAALDRSPRSDRPLAPAA